MRRSLFEYPLAVVGACVLVIGFVKFISGDTDPDVWMQPVSQEIKETKERINTMGTYLCTCSLGHTCDNCKEVDTKASAELEKFIRKIVREEMATIRKGEETTDALLVLPGGYNVIVGGSATGGFLFYRLPAGDELPDEFMYLSGEPIREEQLRQFVELPLYPKDESKT